MKTNTSFSLSNVIIIAEAGVNHNGDVTMAKSLIDLAAEAGVDYVKFQSFKADKLVNKDAEKAEYQKKNSGSGETQYEMLKRLELSEEDHDLLIAYCREKKIQFLSTPFDSESMQMLKERGVQIGKIPSGEITNKPFLQQMAKTFPKLIMSTGMCTMGELEEAVAVLVESGADIKNVTILHCNTEYPTPMPDVNLKAMLEIEKKIGTQVGYSDHTLGIEVPIAAVALGAKIIEKHFTLDNSLPGPDHSASLEPDELRAMVKAIRNIEKAIAGSGEKIPSESEKKNISIARKSIHVNRDIHPGQIITLNDLVMLRPGDGISPMRMDLVLGKKSKIEIKANSKLKWEDLEA